MYKTTKVSLCYFSKLKKIGTFHYFITCISHDKYNVRIKYKELNKFLINSRLQLQHGTSFFGNPLKNYVRGTYYNKGHICLCSICIKMCIIRKKQIMWPNLATR
jgi:hypothetical protein